MNFKSTLIAAAVAVASMGASAATTLDLQPDGFGSFSAQFQGFASGAEFTFTANLGDSLDLLSVTSNYLPGTNPSGFKISAVWLDGVSVGVNDPQPGQFDNWSYSISSLTAGVHTIKVIGTSFDSAASFNGNVQITPVPEPETYALMLAGLGAVGFVARRRRSV